MMGAESAAFSISGADISFWLITGMVAVSAFIAAFSRHIVHAAFALFFTLAGMAGYYVLLGSAFLAVTQVIIYVGGILVLLMFGILLTNRPTEITGKRSMLLRTVELISAALLLELLICAAYSGAWNKVVPQEEPQGSVRELGSELITSQLAALELAGVLLLLGLIGAAYLVRRQEEPGIGSTR